MDKALGFEPRDCGFESRRDLTLFLVYFQIYAFYLNVLRKFEIITLIDIEGISFKIRFY